MSEIAFEIVGQCVRVGVSSVLLAGKRLGDDGLEVASECPIERPQQTRIIVPDRSHKVVHARFVLFVRMRTAQQLVGDDPDRIYIRPRARLVCRLIDLLRGHVLQRPEHLPRLGDHGALIYSGICSDPEIEDLHPPVAIEDDVARLEVPMDDPYGMCVANRHAHIAQDGHACLSAELVFFGELRDADPVDELHRDVGRPSIIGHTRFVNRGDPRMVELGQNIGFTLESLTQLWIERLRPDDLQRYTTPGNLLLGLVHDAHPPLAQYTQDHVLTDLIGKRIVNDRVTEIDCRGIDQRSLNMVKRQQRTYLAGDRLVSGAELIEPCFYLITMITRDIAELSKY